MVICGQYILCDFVIRTTSLFSIVPWLMLNVFSTRLRVVIVKVLISLVWRKNCAIAQFFACFNLIAIRVKSYVASVNADRRPIETQQNVVIDGRCVADGRS